MGVWLVSLGGGLLVWRVFQWVGVVKGVFEIELGGVCEWLRRQ